MSANNPTTPPPSPPNPSSDEAARQKGVSDAAALRYAEAHLQSKPLSPNVDPNKRATVSEAFHSIKPEDFTRVHQTPCAREGLLTGIGSGAAIGALRYLTGAPIPKSSNWAVASGIAVSVFAYEYCQHKRRVERYNLKRIVEVVTVKQQAEQEKAEKAKLAQTSGGDTPGVNGQQQLQQEGAAAKRSWYKFW